VTGPRAGMPRTPQSRPDVVCATQGDVTILLDVANGYYYSCDDVAGLIWALVCDERSVTQIVEAVVAQYDVSPSRATRDIEAFLSDLANAELITWH
jgi:hypothetical protein